MSDVAGGSSGRQAVLTALPLLEALPRHGDGYEAKTIEEAFDAFRRHIAALQSELYELKIHANHAPAPLPGDATRAETLRLVQAGTELARAIEQDARETAARQLARLTEELAPRRRELQEREAAIDQERRQILDAAQADAQAQLAETERRAAEKHAQAAEEAEKILQQARREASELRASAQSEVERMLEQARADARVRARPDERATAAPSRDQSAPEPAPSAPEPAPSAPEPAPSFPTPPLSPEDLAARSFSRLRADSESLE